MSEPLIAAANELRRQIQDLTAQILGDERMSELRKLVTGLNTLEDLCGQSKTTMAAVFNFGANGGLETLVEPDEFYGFESLDAAKRYLKKCKKAVPFREIVAGIKAGGGDPGSLEKLERSLARSTWDVAKIGEDRFGLLEFYPHIKRGKKKRNGSVKEEVEPTDMEPADAALEPELEPEEA